MEVLDHPDLKTKASANFLLHGRGYDWVDDEREDGAGWLLCRTELTQSTEVLDTLRPRNCKRWVALGTFVCPYWNRVKHGVSWQDVPDRTQVFLWETADGQVGVLLPLLCGDYAVTTRGDSDGLRLIAEGGSAEKANLVVAYAACGKDVSQLLRNAARRLQNTCGGFQLRQNKPIPEFVNYLGWCSWDAFYGDVDAKKMLAAAASFERGGVTPGFVILDDGWLEKNGDLLRSFTPDPKKFPKGLSPLVERLKEKFGIRFFGIWHAMTGYWGGIDPESPLAARYKLIRNEGVIRPWSGERQELFLVDPEAAAEFFCEFHRELQSHGVDFLKVDGQSSLEEFTRGQLGRVSTMRRFQEALQESAVQHFRGGLLHCMANGTDVVYSLEQTNLLRNSDDFFPKKDSANQQIHIYTNAINALWSGNFALPDWDMFQSHHRYGEFHAAARAISGGPVYVCDKPGRQNFGILRKLASREGRVWRCDRPALPAQESIFVDCLNEPVLLKLHNCSGRLGVLGFFHCSRERKHLTMEFSPADVPEIKDQRFIAYRFSDGSVEELGLHDRGKVELPRMGFEIITIAPILAGWIAPIGKAEQYVGATSIQKIGTAADRSVTIRFREAGTYLIWCRTAPGHVTVHGRDAKASYAESTGLLTIDIPFKEQILQLIPSQFAHQQANR